MFDPSSLTILEEALSELAAGYTQLPSYELSYDQAAVSRVLKEVAERMRDNYPYAHPMYAGQMLKPPHAVARLAYALSLWINPNNHALDGGRASSAMEKEAVAQLAKMFGWDQALGHLTSGGTMANLEALWIAGRRHPGKKVLASNQAHYTHGRITSVLGIPFADVDTDDRGRMSLPHLESRLAEGDVGTIVTTLGTTALGSVDPLPTILRLAKQHGVRVHVDAAYGGYFKLIDNLEPETRAAYAVVHEADSIVVDPHKHGLQPYGCGCILFKDLATGAFYKHDSPYTYFSSNDLHLGEISLECSRPGAAAVALWATQRLLPLVPNGAFAEDLNKAREAALRLFKAMATNPRFLTFLQPELDIVLWAPQGTSASKISKRSRHFFQAAAERDLHLALVSLPQSLVAPHCPHLIWDQPTVQCLRSCLMKQAHLAWIDRIIDMIDQLGEQVP